MKSAGLILLGVIAGVAVSAALRPIETSCCQRVAVGARDTIAGYAGPFGGLVAGALDATGLTSVLPGLLDKLGVPVDG